jgi:hypothetical protein
MPKKIIPLSDAVIRAVKPSLKAFTLYDGDGLQIRISPSGSKSWLLTYARPLLDKRNNLKLGNYPAIGLAAARKIAAKYRQLLAEGVDPQQWLDQQNSQASADALNTLQSVCEKWFQVKFTSVSKRHAFNIQRSFEQHIFPTAGQLPIKTLRAQQIIGILRPLEKAYKLETLSRLCQRIQSSH